MARLSACGKKAPSRAQLVLLSVLIIAISGLDAQTTLSVMRYCGEEKNPIWRQFLNLGPEWFWGARMTLGLVGGAVLVWVAKRSTKNFWGVLLMVLPLAVYQIYRTVEILRFEGHLELLWAWLIG